MEEQEVLWKRKVHCEMEKQSGRERRDVRVKEEVWNRNKHCGTQRRSVNQKEAGRIRNKQRGTDGSSMEQNGGMWERIRRNKCWSRQTTLNYVL